MEGDDHGRLPSAIEEGLESKLLHAFDQRSTICAVASAARRLAAFNLELVDRGAQCGDDVRGRRKAPLAGLLHVDILIVQIHRQRMTIPLRLSEYRPAHDDHAHSRHAFETLARCSNQRIERHRPHIDRNRAERAHRVDDQSLAMPRDDLRDLFERIQNAGAGFAVNLRDVGDRRIARQSLIDLLR